MDLERLARRARTLDGLSSEGTLRVTWTPCHRVVRLAYADEGAGGPSARWYADHHALARLLSECIRATVHGYWLDPSLGEAVHAYGDGQPVGGEKLLYDEVDVGLEPWSDAQFERMQASWPLGRLARIYGVSRERLVRFPLEKPSLTVPLGARAA